LASLPYLSASEDTDTSITGVITHQEGLAWSGFNLFSGVQSGEAFLIDMNGSAVHTWKLPRADRRMGHAILLPDGERIV